MVEYLVKTVTEWMAERANNAIFPGSEAPAFDRPLLGLASGADQLFETIKDDIGPDFYWSPLDAYRSAFPDDPARASDLTVIAWILPQTAQTRAAQRRAKDLPSLEWSRGRHFGEMVNENLRRFVVATLAGLGVRSVAPALSPHWDRAMSPRRGLASKWSERHAAHVCGLGTFGLSDGLITPAGKAVRVGSVVAGAVLPPTPRPYARHDEWCLAAAGKTCTACVERCPAGAIGASGHDKDRCQAYLRDVTSLFVEREQLGVRVFSCGLCQAGTPCEDGNPTAKGRRRAVGAAGAGG